MTIRGKLDTATQRRTGGWVLGGWIWDPDRPDQALSIRVLADGVAVAHSVADAYRPDLESEGVGNGCHGFVVADATFGVPPGGCLLTVQDEATGEALPGPPLLLQPPVRQDLVVNGYVDETTSERIWGWAWYPDRPDQAVTLRILADGEPIARVVANAHRPDLRAAGIGSGHHAFHLAGSSYKLPLGRCVVTVEDEATGAVLQNSPTRLEPSLALDGPAAQAMLALFDSPGSDEELRARAAFAGRQADRLLQRLSDRRSQRAARTAQRARKWRWRTEDGPEPPRLGLRALVISDTLPKDGPDAGSRTLLSHAASLRRLGFDVLFVPADTQDGPGLPMLGVLGVGCAVEPWSSSVEEVVRREANEFDLVYFHRVDTAARYVPLVSHAMPQARRVFSVGDLHHLRLARQAAVEERPELAAHAKGVRGVELTAAASCHAVVTHSGLEAAMLRQALPRAAVEVVPWHVPVLAAPAGFAERSGVAVLGDFFHAPDLDGLLWLVDEVMPLVWQTAPEVTCTVVGDLPGGVAVNRDPRVRLPGRVPPGEALNQVRSTVAPLAYGAGLDGRVADSLAAGVPCICSVVAAEGHGLPAPLQALVAADAAGLARSIVLLHADAAVFEACRQAGLAHVGQAFSAAAVDAALHRAVAAGGWERSGARREAC